MPSLVAPGAEECEVQGLVGAVLLGDMFKPSLTCGDDEVMRPAVSQDADFLQVGGQVVASGVLACRPRLGTDYEFAVLQLLRWDVDNLPEVLDVGVDALELHLQIFNDLPHSAFLRERNVGRQVHVLHTLGGFHRRIVDPELGEARRLRLLLDEWTKELVDTTFNHNGLEVASAELSLVVLQ